MEAKERRGAQRRHLIQYLGALNGDTGEIIGRVVDISRDGVMLVSRIGILPQVPDSESSVGEGVGNRTNAAPGMPETCGRVRMSYSPPTTRVWKRVTRQTSEVSRGIIRSIICCKTA